MYSNKKNPSTPESPKGVGFFNHFPTNFLRLYSVADPRPDENTVFRRINPKCCEWLTRPKIAMSEFASTIIENLELLAKKKHVAVKRQKFLAVQETLAPFLASLQALNTKTEDQPTSSDVKQVLRTMLTDNEETDEFFDGLVQTGGAMYLLGIHYGVVKTLLTNPSQYAERVVGTASDVSTFKSNPTIPGMQHFLTGQCSSQEPRTGQTHVKARRNLASLLEDDSDNEEASTSGAQPRKPAAAAPSSGRSSYIPPIESDSDDDPEIPPPPPRSERKRQHGGEAEELNVLSDDDKGKGKGKSPKNKRK